MKRKKKWKFFLIVLGSIIGSGLLVVAFLYYRISNRTLIQFDIHQNKELIHQSVYAEPPQFAIWIEDIETKRIQTVYVTERVSIGDWEGKANVPDALPRWVELFKKSNYKHDSLNGDNIYDAVTGATPIDEYFSVRIEVKPMSKWICWIEMNLAGDYNETFPKLNQETLEEDEFECGQPALLYSDTVTALNGTVYNPLLFAVSVWKNGENKIKSDFSGITTAKNIFDTIKISVIRPKPKLINIK